MRTLDDRTATLALPNAHGKRWEVDLVSNAIASAGSKCARPLAIGHTRRPQTNDCIYSLTTLPGVLPRVLHGAGWPAR